MVHAAVDAPAPGKETPAAMARRSPKPKLQAPELRRAVFGGVSGGFLGLSLLKFGNPVILDVYVVAPTNGYELALQPWPILWGYGLWVAVALAGLLCWPWRRPSRDWLVWLPLVWLAWQSASATQTVDARLTGATLPHFSAGVAGFYLGLMCLARVERLGAFWVGLLVGFLAMLWTGFEQHFGGLEATRRYVFSQPGWENLPAEHLKRIRSERIFGTMLYPNALAGVVLLLLPVLVAATWEVSGRLTRITRAVLTGLVGYAGLACLYWSGSKAGWLIGLLLGLVCVLHLRFDRRLKWGVVGTLLVVGLIGFGFRYSAYFAKGATSVGARFDYWRAGVQTFLDRPVWGSGPGTFSVCYARLKRPEAEMARLAHNDYLQQASDSGVLGGAAYTVFVVGSLVRVYRRSRAVGVRLGCWLGLVGWAVQGLVEFGLHIPAIGWVAFWLLGWLHGTPEPDGVVGGAEAKEMAIGGGSRASLSLTGG